ncbi:hypothetical protein EMPS_07495 [Entomortierella parvispora]|uniref:Uncharacterized protein n=1 Tax=Entomortierella parvispora TaxID=205924 RepID=A0A9P3HF21_9FUNG|nr:hypothetical protein EMPS_07495 [Entomortierella parvispora]
MALTTPVTLFLEQWGHHLKVLEIGFFDWEDNPGSLRLMTFLQNHLRLREFTLRAPLQITSNKFRGLLMSLTCSTLAPVEKVKLSVSVFFDALESWHTQLFPDIPRFEFTEECSAAPIKRPSGLITDLDISDVEGREIHTTILPYFLKEFCPKLKRLALPIVSMDSVPTLCDTITTGLPDLRHLNLSEARTTDSETASILTACGKPLDFEQQDEESSAGYLEARRLESFKAPSRNSRIGSDTVEALVNHHSKTLQDIDLSQCFAVSGNMIKTILQACARLVRFDTLHKKSPELDYIEKYLMTSSKAASRDPFVHFKEPEHGEPPSEKADGNMSPAEPSILTTLPTSLEAGWACSQTLRILSLQYLETSSEVFPLILSEQLSRLVQLEELRLRRRALLASSRPLRSPGASLFLGQTSEAAAPAAVADPGVCKDNKATILNVVEQTSVFTTTSAVLAATTSTTVAATAIATTVAAMDPAGSNHRVTLLEMFSKPKPKSPLCLNVERRQQAQKRLQIAQAASRRVDQHETLH